MSYRKKLFTFLADLHGSPMAQDQAVAYTAEALGVKSRLIRGEIKAIRQQAAQSADSPDIESATDDLFFDGTSYWRREIDGNFGKLGREDGMLELRRRGFAHRKTPGSEVSPVELAIHHVQTNARVVYAAAFCGRAAGRHVENGLALLATDSPKIIPACPGNPERIVSLLQDLLGRAASDPFWEVQYHTFLAWLQRARRALQNPSQHLPGQLVALVGGADIGKTLTQTLITRMLGGREADPGLWLAGESLFNDAIWGAEHWCASDSNIPDTLAARKTLRDRIKQATANESLGCHRKHRPEITLRPIARITLSANDDADSSCVLPLLDDSIKDKLIYLKCYAPPVPFPTTTEADAATFFKGLTDAIPAFLHVVEAFEVPQEMRKGRFGVREFHHSDIACLLTAINQDGPLGDLLTKRLDALVGGPDGSPAGDFIGSAVELFQELEIQHGQTFRSVCHSPTLLGQALRRLGRVDGWRGRITSQPIRKGPNHQKQTQWTIRRALPGSGPQAPG